MKNEKLIIKIYKIFSTLNILTKLFKIKNYH